jgi:glycosyltransferase EpsD
MEAMACGLPVVASANRGHRELVVKAKTGFLSNTNDHQGLAKTLCKLALQFETRTAMGERGRARIKLEYSKEHVTKILFRIYDI